MVSGKVTSEQVSIWYRMLEASGASFGSSVRLKCTDIDGSPALCVVWFNDGLLQTPPHV